MTPFLPRPDAVADWLLAHEVAALQPADVGVTAAERVHAQLRAGLVVFLGPTGFDSLWARAQYLAQPGVPTGAGVAVLPPGAPAADADHQAVLVRFITLLFTFVGVALGMRLLHQLWPALPLAAADRDTRDDAV